MDALSNHETFPILNECYFICILYLCADINKSNNEYDAFYEVFFVILVYHLRGIALPGRK